MASIGELLVEIKATKEQFDKTLKESGNSLYKFADTAEKVGQKMSSIGTKMSIGITAPLALIGKKSLDAAMAAVESENLFEVSMEEMAGAARKWSEDISNSLGLNEYTVRQNVGTFNVMFDSMGIGKQKALDMSEGFTQLAYDMASFYNLKPEEAFLKLQAGITGEIEPLKRLGIIINETTVQAYAYKTGIAELGSELTEQEKVQARYALIMEQTSKAQGDMARTIDSPTNQLRIFKEQVTQASIELGNALIPMFSKLLDIVKPLIEKFKNLTDEQKDNIVKWGLVAAAAGPTLMVLGNGIKTVAGLTKVVNAMSTAFKGFFGTLAAGNIAVLGVVGGIFNTVTAISGYVDITKKAKDETYSWQETVTRLMSPMLQLLDNIEWVDKAFKTAFGRDLKENMEDSSASTGKLALEMMQLKNNLGNVRGEVEDTTEEYEEQKESIDELIASINNLYNLNQSVTEATWEYEDSLSELTKIMKDANATEREKQSAIFATQDALENLQIAMVKEYEATETSIERKKELQNQYIITGLEAVNAGAMSEAAFVSMAKSFGLTTADIIKLAGDLGIELDAVSRARLITITMDTSQATQQVRDLQSLLNTAWSKSQSLGTNLKVSQILSVRDSGGYARGTNFVKDLGVVEINGEAFLPKELTNAIKTMRSDFSGIMPTGSSNIPNQSGQVVNQYITINKEIDESNIGKIIAKNLSW